MRASETVSGYTIRAWTGVATDEGVGLISMVEVCDARGLPVCRFEEFLADSVRRTDPSWPREQDAAAKALQRRAIERAREAVLGNALRARARPPLRHPGDGNADQLSVGALPCGHPTKRPSTSSGRTAQLTQGLGASSQPAPDCLRPGLAAFSYSVTSILISGNGPALSSAGM